MDKFGVFNILNSFFDLLGTRKEENGEATSGKSGENASSGSGFSSGGTKNSFGSSYLKSEKNASARENAEKHDVAEARARSAPLQSSMLNTLNNHDDFIRRVNERNKKRNT